MKTIFPFPKTEPAGPGGSEEDPFLPEDDALPSAARGMIACPHCQAVNFSEREFCGQCGRRLWESCPVCERPNLFHQKFCSHCGASLGVGDEASRNRYEAAWEDARRLREEFRFDEALAAYRLLIKTPENDPQDLVRATRGLIGECLMERKRLLQDRQAAGAEARQCLSRQEFRRAWELLSSIPAPLRDEDHGRLREQAREGLAEIRRLKAALEAARSGPLSLKLLCRLGRFLALSPEDDSFRDLAIRLQGEVAKEVKKLLAACQYEKAKKVLDHVPEPLRDDSLQAVHHRVEELCWLAWDLRSSPAADEVLPAVARRFQALAPHDRKNGSLCRLLAERTARFAREKSFGWMAWAAPPKRTFLGPPLRWIGGLERFAAAERPETAAYCRHPGRFSVACGLALQVLNQGLLRNNFLPEESSFLKRLAVWKTRRKPTTAWGMDLGVHALKAVKLRWEERSQKAWVESAVCLEHRKPLSHAVGESEYHAIVQESLGAFLARHPRENERVALGLSATHFYFGQFELPAVPAEKIASAVRFEAQQRFPLALKDLTWNYLDFPAAAAENKPSPWRITVAGVKSQWLKNRLEKIAEAGLEADLVQCDGLALYNFAAFSFFGDAPWRRSPPCPAKKGPTSPADQDAVPVRPGPALAFVDLGGEGMNFVVCAPQAFFFRTFSTGAHRLNRLLVRQCRLTFAQAEQWKRNPTAAPDLGNLWDALEAGFADLGQTVADAVEAYRTAYPDVPLERCFAVGGGFLVHGLLRYLWFER